MSMAIEISPYKVLEKISDDIEIREYKKLILATSNIDEEESGNSAFRSLFKFISGENDQEQEIKMTAPVFQEKKIGNKMNMSFVMPAKFDENNLQKPNDKNIKINIIKNQKFIVIRFSGFANDGNFEENQEILEKTIKEKKIEVDLKNGMSYSDIRDNLEDIYQVPISNGTISKITDRLLPELEEWRNQTSCECLFYIVFRCNSL